MTCSCSDGGGGGRGFGEACGLFGEEVFVPVHIGWVVVGPWARCALVVVVGYAV